MVLTDQFAIAPFVDIRAWCWDRLAYSIKRLSRVTGPTIFGEPLAAGQRTVTTPCLARTQPVVRDSAHQELGETLQRTACHYGHLHIPTTTIVDDIPHVEVSLGYPREWRRYGENWEWPYKVMEIDDA